tara:strand:+ start:2163 stop:2843 length:681 start_codon:yes stop_codon:yes gene_type:complete
MKKIAILIVGDVRDCYAKDLLKASLSDFDIFIGSYIKHESFLKDFGKVNYMKLIQSNEIRLPHNITKEKYQQNMLQFLHIDNIIKNFNDKLNEYDYIFKFRFDILLHTNVPYKDYIYSLAKNIKERTLYNDSDKFFFCTTQTFFKLFHDFYDNIIRLTHSTIENYDGSFEYSWKAEPSFMQNALLKNIEFKRSNMMSIIRGTYNKEVGDGNRKLYDKNDKLQGKFQ